MMYLHTHDFSLLILGIYEKNFTYCFLFVPLRLIFADNHENDLT